MAYDERIPKYHELMNPLLDALHSLGGSASIQEISAHVMEQLNLPEEVLNILHDPEKSSQTEIEYRLAWARTYLKKYGLLDNSERGVWVILPKKKHIKRVNPKKVRQELRQRRKRNKSAENHTTKDEIEEETTEQWRSDLHDVLVNKLSPEGFERLTKRLLREAGFVQVEVTGRSGDGGIDGKGIVRIGGLLTFHIFFQCKKYKGSVSSSAIRDFRGAFVGRADKGLFVTTGTFTRSAKEEASRDGATPIDLMDGDQLADKLKDFGLGVKTEMVESVEVDLKWFEEFQ